jgi:hypothetical protein
MAPRLAGIVVMMFMLFVDAASADVVSGGLEDPRGDGYTSTQVWPYDLGVYELTYDSAGTLTATFSYYREETSRFGFGYTVEASVGVWDPARGTCDAGAPGGLALDLHPPFEYDFSGVTYSIVGYRNGETQERSLLPRFQDNRVTFTVTDRDAFAGRGYDCVTGVTLRNYADGLDTADGTFCMSPSGTVPCPTPGEPIGIRWSSPRDGQTVSGFLHEGESDCWAVSSGPVVRTENWVDGVFHDAQVNRPWGCEIDTRTLSDGPHTLTVKAFAADGRMVEDTVTVLVANGSASTPAAPAASTVAPAAPTTPAPSTEQPAQGGQTAPSTALGGAATEPAARSRLRARRLSRGRATALARSVLARRFGRAFARRAQRGYRLSCTLEDARHATCRVAWRHGQWRYSGVVRVTRTGRRDRAAVRVSRRKAR